MKTESDESCSLNTDFSTMELPDIPLRYLPILAYHDLAEFFDTPSINMITLEGLADRISELSNFTVRTSHMQATQIRSNCKGGESPTVLYLQGFSKTRQATIKLLQRAIISLETGAEHILPKYLNEACQRYQADGHHLLFTDNAIQHTCVCRGCAPNKHDAFHQTLPMESQSPKDNIRNPFPSPPATYGCLDSNCQHNIPWNVPGNSANVTRPRRRERDRLNNQNPNNLGSRASNVQNVGLSMSDNQDVDRITFKIDNVTVKRRVRAPENFVAIPPSNHNSDTEDNDDDGTGTCTHETNTRLSTTGVIHSPSPPNQETIYDRQSANNDTRRQSDPILEDKSNMQVTKSGKKSDGDIPNIPDQCTCFRDYKLNGPKTIFVSLADHDKEHTKEVIHLCKELKSCGFEVKCDMMEKLFREKSINVNDWLENCFAQSRFVVFCISPTYHRYTRPDFDLIPEACPTSNQFHTRYIFDRARTEFIQNNSLNYRFLPVVFTNSGAEKKHIPEFMGSTIHYAYPNGLHHLKKYIARKQQD